MSNLSVRAGDILLLRVPFLLPLRISGRGSFLFCFEVLNDKEIRLCWEQNVHVIVMLTREVEGSHVKCGSYWTDTDFGPLRLRLVSTEGLSPSEERPQSAHPTSATSQNAASSSASSNFFPQSASASNASKRFFRHHHYRSKRSELVKRTFSLTHTGYPEAQPRKIVHLQYLEWPDMNVPDDPRGVLGLIRQIDEAMRETREDEEVKSEGGKRQKRKKFVAEVDEKTGIAKYAMGANSPVLLHCSAGVGRTGGFIAVDAVLDAIRMELRAKFRAKKEAKEREDEEKRRPMVRGDEMDVDAKNMPKTVAVKISSGASLSSPYESEESLVVHVPLATAPAPMEVDGMAEDAPSPSPPPSEPHKFNKAGTIQWAKNVRDETGVEGERLTQSRSQTETPGQSPPRRDHDAGQIPQPYASTSSSRTGSTPELNNLLNSNGDDSSSSATGDSLRTTGNSSGVYLTSTTSLGTSVSGASATSSVLGSSKDKVNLGGEEESKSSTRDLLQAVLNQQARAVEKKMRGVGVNGQDGVASSSLAFGKQRKEYERKPSSSISSFVMSSEGEGGPSRSMSPPEEGMKECSRPQHPLLILHPKVKDRTSVVLDQPTDRKTDSVNASEAPAAPTVELTACGGFDYKEPRPLHEDFTPPPLSTFEEPVWEVVHDMREQRMSLCQSLRQYVFVHAAVIEGSLMVLDEEREIAEGFGRWKIGGEKGVTEENFFKGKEAEGQDEDAEGMMRMTPDRQFGEVDNEMLMFVVSSPPPTSSSDDSRSQTPVLSSVQPSPVHSRSSSRSRSRSRSSRRRRHYYHHHHHHHTIPPSTPQPFLYSNDTVVPPAFAPSYGYGYGYGKRPSSPTELLKENKKGELVLSKRPSIERKRRSTEVEAGSAAQTRLVGAGSASAAGSEGVGLSAPL
jgi:protein tyrosine phosphatase